MKILALDPGTVTGVAYARAGHMPYLDTWRLPEGQGAEVGAFFAEFERLLTSAIIEGQPDILVFEAPFVGPKLLSNMNACRRVIGLPCVIELIAHKMKLEVAECNLMTVRSHFVGKGRCDKHETIAACRRAGVTPADDHQADAFACFWWTVACQAPEQLAFYDPLQVAARRAEMAAQA
ncbi:MAG TPA: hypothetical protein VG735_07895 [Caulobacterales bacterium]|nr:hypothetical protein [Caulobacterales bacterium]